MMPPSVAAAPLRCQLLLLDLLQQLLVQLLALPLQLLGLIQQLLLQLLGLFQNLLLQLHQRLPWLDQRMQLWWGALLRLLLGTCLVFQLCRHSFCLAHC